MRLIGTVNDRLASLVAVVDAVVVAADHLRRETEYELICSSRDKGQCSRAIVEANMALPLDASCCLRTQLPRSVIIV